MIAVPTDKDLGNKIAVFVPAPQSLQAVQVLHQHLHEHHIAVTIKQGMISVTCLRSDCRLFC